MCKHIVEDELLDFKVDHHVSVKLALQQPPQRLQIGDVVTDLGLTAGSASASRRHRLEQEPRRVELGPRSRPAGPGLEGAVIYHYRRGCMGQILYGELKNWIRGGFPVLERENLTHRSFFGSHFENV